MEKTKTYSEEPIEIEGLKKFLTLRRKFEKTIDNAIEDYFKDKPKLIRCFTFSMNTNHWVVITEDYNVHDIIVVYKDNKFQVEIRQDLNFENWRNKFITNFCKEMKLPRWLIEG